MQSVFAAMGRCPLFEGIPKEKYPNVLTCLQGEARAVSVSYTHLDVYKRQPCDGVGSQGTQNAQRAGLIGRQDKGIILFSRSSVCVHKK